jgi:hypothetical protein
VEGAPHTAERIIVVLWGAPLHTYIKEEREEAGPLGARQVWGVLLGLLVLVGFPFPFSGVGKGERERE